MEAQVLQESLAVSGGSEPEAVRSERFRGRADHARWTTRSAHQRRGRTIRSAGRSGVHELGFTLERQVRHPATDQTGYPAAIDPHRVCLPAAKPSQLYLPLHRQSPLPNSMRVSCQRARPRGDAVLASLGHFSLPFSSAVPKRFTRSSVTVRQDCAIGVTG